MEGPTTTATDHRRARQTSGRSLARSRQTGGSRTTVLVALAANAVIFLAKLAGGILSGSAAMLSEAAHSLADTTNQGFLLASIGLAQREPTERQPFGHGRQRYLWTFVAAISMFAAGSVFAVGFGIYELVHGEGSSTSYTVAWIVLAVSAAAEGASWIRAVRQTRREARAAGRPPLRYARESRDPNVKMILFEDSAALAGVALAAAGIGLHELTGNAAWDPIASIAIGVLLIAVAGWMARDMSSLLVGAAARPDERAEIERVIEDHPAVHELLELLTMVLGPNALLVAARVDLRDDMAAGRVEQAATELEDAVREAVPDVTELFLDATPGRGRPAPGP